MRTPFDVILFLYKQFATSTTKPILLARFEIPEVSSSTTLHLHYIGLCAELATFNSHADVT